MKSRLALSILAAALAVAFPAHAKSPAATQLDPVVISAERSRQTTFDAPAAISAVRRETIEDGGPQVTLKAQLRQLAGGTTPREVIEKFKTMQMVDVQLPTTDGRQLTLPRYTQPEPDHRMLLEQLRLSLPSQPPPRITAAQAAHKSPALTL